jgi:signal transduction histidine kinase
MKTQNFFRILACAAFFLGAAAHADERVTKDDAVTMVKAAIAELQSDGHYTTLTDISNPHGKFTKNELYLVAYDMNGKCVAHGADHSVIGMDRSKIKDNEGKAFIEERITLAKTQESFWQNYKYVNPITHAIDAKQSYCEVADDLIICGGVYGQP